MTDIAHAAPAVRPARLLPLLLAAVLTLAGCATGFPTVDSALPDDGSARTIFYRSLAAHGGDLRDHPGDINLSMSGEWYSLIQRIQPVVTDAGWRITAEERFRPSEQLYAVRHGGPQGTKAVVRTPGRIAVAYDDVPVTDPATLRATAMTTDAFQMFHFGPSFIHWHAQAMRRLPDASEGGRRYHRLLATLRPGFGEAATDDMVLWIDMQTNLLFRVHMTLNGFETTQGAHVDTTFLDYARAGPYLLPVRFHERVRGPLRIDAHRWWTTGLDVDRGWQAAEVANGVFTGRAAAPATPTGADGDGG